MSEPAEGDGIQQVQKRQALYQNAAERLLSSNWGTRITDAETGERRDTGVMAAVEEIVSLLMSGQLTLSDTLVLRSTVQGKPALKIIDEAPGGSSYPPIEITNVNGQVVKLGFGLQSQGITASEFVPLPYYYVSGEEANRQYTNTGGNTGPDGTTGLNDPTRPTVGSPAGGASGSGASGGMAVGDGTGWKPIGSSGSPGYPIAVSSLGSILANLFGQGGRVFGGCGLEFNNQSKTLKVKNSDLAGEGIKVGTGCALDIDLDTDGSLVISEGKLRAGGINTTFRVIDPDGTVTIDGDCNVTIPYLTVTVTNGVITGIA